MADFATLSEASTFLGVSKATLRNWDKVGKLKAVRHPLNDYRMYSLPDLHNLRAQLSLPLESAFEDKRGTRRHELTIREVRQVLGKLHNVLRNTDADSNLMFRFDELSKLLSLSMYSADGSDNFEIFNQLNLCATQYAENVRQTYKAFCSYASLKSPPEYTEIRCSDEAIYECGKILSVVNFQSASLDIKGLAYEEMIRYTFDKSDNQQFFTPNQIVSFITKFYGEYISGHICDPASGTGGFLVEVAKSGKRYLSLTGFEIDERLSWVTGQNIYLHGGKKFESLHLKDGGSLGKHAEKYFAKFDLILTNPPFGSDYSNQEDLTKYILGRNKKSRRRGILFIERCWKLLKPGGRVAIVLDEGVLNLSQSEDVRKFLLDHFTIDAIVSLPEVTFMPYANVNTSILFMQKTKSPVNQEVFFGRARKVGRRANGDEDIKYYIDGNFSTRSDLPDILNGWLAGSKGSQKGAELYHWTNLYQNFECAKDSLRLDYRFHHPSREESISRLKSTKWPLKPISELCIERNVSYIPAKELNDSTILYTGLAHIEPLTGLVHQVPTLANSLKSAVKQYEPMDIVFAKMRPSLRKVALMNFEEGGYVSSECVVLQARQGSNQAYLLDPFLLCIVLRSDLVFGQITHLIAGIGRPRLNLKDLRTVCIPVPPAEIQRDIRIEYEKAAEKIKILREQAKHFIREAKSFEVSAINSLSSMLIGEQK